MTLRNNALGSTTANGLSKRVLGLFSPATSWLEALRRAGDNLSFLSTDKIAIVFPVASGVAFLLQAMRLNSA
jgi:hypothetical protein